MKRAIITGVIAAGLLSGCSTMNQEWHNDCQVKAKDVLYSSTDGNSSRTKRVTTSCGSFNVSSSLSGGFDSWDNWSALQVDKTYDIRTGGYRQGIFDMFPTVIEIRGPKQTVGRVI